MSWVGVRSSGYWTHELTYYVDGTDTTVFDPLTAVQRIACHALVNQVPDRGLEEVLESLRLVYEFYSFPPLPARQITAKSVTAKRGKTLARPSFTVGTDEL